jgi:hypothetical protein
METLEIHGSKPHGLVRPHADPYALHDISLDQPKIRQSLEKKLDGWRTKLPEPPWLRRGTHMGLVCGRETEFVN